MSDMSAFWADWLHFLTEGVALGSVCVFGVCANSLASWVLASTKEVDLSRIFTKILITLTTFDSVLLVGLFAIYSWPLFDDNYKRDIYPWVVPIVLPAIQISLTGSVYMTMAISIERYLSLRSVLSSGAKAAQNMRPLEEVSNATRFSAPRDPGPGSNPCGTSLIEKVLKYQPRSPIGYIVPIGTFSLLYNITRFFELRTEKRFYKENFTVPSEPEWVDLVEDFIESKRIITSNASHSHQELNISYYSVEMTEMRANYSYILGYILVSNFIVMAVIPLVVLITMNFLLYKLLQSQQLSTLANLHRKAKRDQTVAAMFIIIVIVFVLCHTLKVTCSVYELFKVLLDNHHNWPDWTRHLIGLNHLLLGVNSSINILIYSWKDSKFRKALLQKVCFFWTDTKCHRMVPCPKQMTTSRESPNQGQQDSQIMR